jgi:hypothetical protein
MSERMNQSRMRKQSMKAMTERGMRKGENERSALVLVSRLSAIQRKACKRTAGPK